MGGGSILARIPWTAGKASTCSPTGPRWSRCSTCRGERRPSTIGEQAIPGIKLRGGRSTPRPESMRMARRAASTSWSLQGEISGLSRSVSNLGSSLGAAVAGTILVSSIGDKSYAAAMIVLACIGVVGLVATMLPPCPACFRRRVALERLTLCLGVRGRVFPARGSGQPEGGSRWVPIRRSRTMD